MNFFQIFSSFIFLIFPFVLMIHIDYKEIVLHKDQSNEKKFWLAGLASILFSIGWVIFMLFVIIAFTSNTNAKVLPMILLFICWLLFSSNSLLIIKQSKKVLTPKSIMILSVLSFWPFLTFGVIFYVGWKIDKIDKSL